MKYQAIVLAAGNATRAALTYNKVFYKIKGEPIIYLASLHFLNDVDCEKIYVVCKENEEKKLKKIFKDNIKIQYIYGGSSRQESVYNALKCVDSEYVIIHDGARPFYTLNLLNSLKEKLLVVNAVIPVIEVVDTLKEIKDGKIVKTLNREKIKRVQTPQGFKTSVILTAHQNAKKCNYTDDASMVEKLTDEDVYIIDGESKNIKYTNKEDF